MTAVIGIRFKKAGKVYYFAAGNFKAKRGEFAIVETARGAEFGEVWLPNRFVPNEEIVPPLRPVIRIATEADVAHNEVNRQKEKDAFRIGNEKILAHGLDMKLVDVQYTFDNSKLLFYFTSAGRVDFRELVKDLASVFRTRIELRQIGIRDEAKLIGGLGVCGRTLCCSGFLSNFGQVSIKMAKEQNLSLNSSKISGNCGRLMCCLRYEHQTYEAEIKLTPPVDSVVKTPDGVGTVCEISPMTGMIKVKLKDADPPVPKAYHRDTVTVISRPKRGEKDDDEDAKEE
ncbi:MAG: stage 0 sporulation family protein [Clostridia bacterium]|nr:stage 0 sporulation family protein [Clostridia bacterium]